MSTQPAGCWGHVVSADKALASFPADVQPALEGVLTTRGVVEEPLAAELMAGMRVDRDQLMIKLLRLARAYAITPISGYAVGAVASGVSTEGAPGPLYLGANVEICGESPSFTIHAEQAATINAWHHGERGIEVLATSSAPCGYCRQFLWELTTGEELEILLTSPSGDRRVPLRSYLPGAFGPRDLHVDARLMEPEAHNLRLTDSRGSTIARAALEAAATSYAPYTKGFSGAAIELADGTVWAGRYAENAAHNPTLRPLTTAATFMAMNRPVHDTPEIVAAALVELPSAAGERGAEMAVLEALAPGVHLQYHTAELF